MKLAKNISFYIVLATIITCVGYYLESEFLFTYLQKNLIGLLLTLLAINIASLGLIASKIQDIVLQLPGFDFSETIKEMKLSLKEQIALIGTAIVTLLLQDSEKICFEYKEHVGNVVLVAILIYAINILWDTGKAVFIIIENIQNLNNNEE
ncbi:hypothetical protein [uncultured Draconibacterium sp.]|uniref:hypothetical protein n=1 Tax=uncultured Draconibacterium sp. TaxID=1573823 RepID=UPI002AA95114|nr:hypothetical protein [uncultured Draconibacterium sp.]